MKETINISIASQAFTMDEDAYAQLKEYLSEIQQRLPQDDSNTMEDIEARIADIFREQHASPMMTIPLATVRTAMALLGDPSDFGEIPVDNAAAPQRDEPSAQNAKRKLYRSRENRSLAGVCGGIAEFFDADPTVIRLVTLLLILFGGLSIWIYIILWIILPEKTLKTNRKQR